MRGLVGIFPCEKGFVAWYKDEASLSSSISGSMAGFSQRPILMWGLFAALLQSGEQDQVICPIVRDFDDQTLCKAQDLPDYLGFTAPGELGEWFMARHDWREGRGSGRGLRLLQGPGGRDGPVPAKRGG